MKLKKEQNEFQSISFYNLNKLEYVLKTDSKKGSQNKKQIHYFSSKKKLNNDNKTLRSISNTKKEEKNINNNFNLKTKTLKNKNNNTLKQEKHKINNANIIIGPPIKMFCLQSNKMNKNKTKSVSKNLSYNNYFNKDNKSSSKNKIFLSTTQKLSNKKTVVNYKSSNYSTLKTDKNNIENKLNKSDINTDLYRTNNKRTFQYSKNNKSNNKNKSIIPLNIIYSNNPNKINKEERNSNTPHEKILVIDLDETLIHTSFKKIPKPDFTIQLDSTIYTKKAPDNKMKEEISIKKIIEAYICIRPGVNEFLNQLSKHYSLYVYSASSKQYLNNIIKNIDKNNVIEKCFCRDDCIIYVENTEEDFDKPNNKYNYVKDLKKINKNLRNIVFVDNNIMSFKLQEKNGIPIKSWFNDYDDIELYKLIPILKNLAGFYDVRIEIEKFVKNKTFIWSKSINWLKNNCLNSAYLNEVNLILKKEQQKSDFRIENYNTNNCNNSIFNKNSTKMAKNNKNKIINHISNILINLNEISNNNNNMSMKKMVEKSSNFYEKINTEFNKSIQRNNCKVLNTNKAKLLNSDKKPLIKTKKVSAITNKLALEIPIPISEKIKKTQVKFIKKKNDKDKNDINPNQNNLNIQKIDLIKNIDMKKNSNVNKK